MSLPFAQMSFPEIYEQALVRPLFEPWAELVLEDVGLRTGDRFLDVACGTGIVARLASERLGDGAKIVGIDVSAPMIAVARRVAPAIDWREGDAGALPLSDGEEFEAVVCQQGFQFFPDRAAAARQMHRALVAGGRLAVSTWRPDDEAPFVRDLRRIAERHVGPIVDRRHSFGESGPLEQVLRDAGFQNVNSRTPSRTIHFDDGPLFARLNAMALVGMSGPVKTMSDEEREQVTAVIVGDSAELVKSHADGDGISYEIASNVTTARRG